MVEKEEIINAYTEEQQQIYSYTEPLFSEYACVMQWNFYFSIEEIVFFLLEYF